MAKLVSVAARLRAAGHKLAVAESSAGGTISSGLLGVSGASAWFAGGVVCYSKESKQSLLGLDSATSRPTASEGHALELAAAVRDRLGADWGIGETGVAGPAANSRGIAPGVCALAVVGPDGAKHATTLWPDETLSAADAYGQPPKLTRREAMNGFSEAAFEILSQAVPEHGVGNE